MWVMDCNWEREGEEMVNDSGSLQCKGEHEKQKTWKVLREREYKYQLYRLSVTSKWHSTEYTVFKLLWATVWLSFL